MSKQQQRRLVRPMDIVEDNDQTTLRRNRTQIPRNRLEHAEALVHSVALGNGWIQHTRRAAGQQRQLRSHRQFGGDASAVGHLIDPAQNLPPQPEGWRPLSIEYLAPHGRHATGPR
jgi:hypothetical protein